MSYTYRLSFCLPEEGAPYYKGVEERSAENAGFDLYVVKDYEIVPLAEARTPTLLDLGTAARMVRVYATGQEEEVHYWLCPRSSIYKTGMVMANSQGIIDSSYRGGLKAPIWIVAPMPFIDAFKEASFKGFATSRLWRLTWGTFHRCGLWILCPVTQRGAGGFGSTGK
jgi:dUTPase